MFTINREKLEYIIVFIAVLGMGSLYFQVLNMPLMAVMEVVSGTIMLRNDFIVSKRGFNEYFAITLLFLLTSFINLKNGFYINDLIIWCTNVFFILVIQSHMTFESFKQKFVRIMVLEALVSLICFFWADILGNSLPFMVVGQNAVNGYYMTPYFTVGWYNIPVFHRNAGMYNEPGAHQIFLNFALLFLLSDNEHLGLTKKKYQFSLLILIIAVLTTQSTTGYMCLFVVLTAIVMKKTEGRRNTKLKIVVILIIAVLSIIELQTGIIENKISGIATGHGSGLTRFNDTYYGYYLALSKPFLGHGVFMANQKEILKTYGINNISNGMASFAIKAGCVITVFFLVEIYKGMKKQLPHGIYFNICAFLLFILCVNSEGMFLNILFLLFIGQWKNETSNVSTI